MTLIDTIFPKARSEVLRLLFTDPERSLHLRDIARLSGLAIGTIQREVTNLRDVGIISERRDGNRLYFAANRQNPIFPELQRIAIKTTGLVSQLTNALEDLEGIDLAFVYGSYAEGSLTSESDIDLLIIGDIGLRALSPRLRPVSDAMEREINPNTFSKKSFKEKLRADDAYITNVTNGKKLWIIGSEDELRAMA